MSTTRLTEAVPSISAAADPRLLVVEDHPLFRDALVGVVSAAFPGAEIVQATSINGALDVLASHGPMDLILLDLSMPGTTGLLGAYRVRAAAPRSALAIVSAHEDSRIVARAMSFGIAAYIPKSTPKAELAQLIGSVLDGSTCFPKHVQEAVEVRRARADMQNLLRLLGHLTSQQLRVLDMICLGLQNKHIAFELDISVTTVKVHVSDILRKLAVRSRTEAIIKVSALDFNRTDDAAPAIVR